MIGNSGGLINVTSLNGFLDCASVFTKPVPEMSFLDKYVRLNLRRLEILDFMKKDYPRSFFNSMSSSQTLFLIRASAILDLSSSQCVLVYGAPGPRLLFFLMALMGHANYFFNFYFFGLFIFSILFYVLFIFFYFIYFLLVNLKMIKIILFKKNIK